VGRPGGSSRAFGNGEALLHTACIVANAGITTEAAAELVSSGKVDAIAFGRMFIANPDLPERVRRNRPKNELRYVGLYGDDGTGNTDYPALEPHRP
jgi:2,4-dienoyl-CoA reductase-like NADH-dependent reductase (Old Yellow Enzyme family)